MNWEKHPTSKKYIVGTTHAALGLPCLVRTEIMDKGYLWQAGKYYGYAPTLLAAQNEAEEVLLIQLFADIS